MKTKRIIWAFDPFDSSSGLHEVSAKLLRLISRLQPLTLEAVYVLNPSETGDQDPSPGHYILATLPAVQNALDSAVRQVTARLAKVVKAHVLVQRKTSLQHTVRCLANYAYATDADLIVCETHARHGLPRLFMGSFTESLLLESRVPVLVVNPLTHAKPIHRILFPTDFSDESQSFFDAVVDLASTLDASLSLLNVIPRSIEPMIQEGAYLLGGGWVTLGSGHSYSEHDKKVADAWIERAKRRGVHARATFDSNSFGLRQTILNHARAEGAGLIALGARNGRMSAAVFGSISRQIVREADCPVLVAKSWGVKGVARRHETAA